MFRRSKTCCKLYIRYRTTLGDEPEVHSLGTNSVPENPKDGVPSQPSCKFAGDRDDAPSQDRLNFLLLRLHG